MLGEALRDARIDLALLLDVEALRRALPVAEREEYERCQRSIIQARASAPANEGQRVVV